jgi:hypothetical protein
LVVVAGGDKRAVVELTHLFSSTTLYVKASAPIDDDTRIAAFTSDNHLASGFAGTVQWGYDARAIQVAKLERDYQVLQDNVKALGTLKELTPAEWEAYSTRHGLGGSSDEIARTLCGPGACTPAVAARAVCAAVSATDGGCAPKTSDDEVVKGATTAAAAALPACNALRADADSATLDRCFAVKFWVQTQYREATYAAILHGKQLERRDLLLTGALATKDTAWALVGDASFSYDRASVYQDDLASEPVDAVSYQASAGATATLYPGGLAGVAFHLRAGVERSRGTGASKVERCASSASTSADVTGRACDGNALFRTGGAPAAESSFSLRLAASYQYRGAKSETDVVPGVEVRLGLDGIGADKTGSVRLAFFGTPMKGASAARVGIAVETDYALDAGDGERKWTVTPLVFVGASLESLLKK